MNRSNSISIALQRVENYFSVRSIKYTREAAILLSDVLVDCSPNQTRTSLRIFINNTKGYTLITEDVVFKVLSYCNLNVHSNVIENEKLLISSSRRYTENFIYSESKPTNIKFNLYSSKSILVTMASIIILAIQPWESPYKKIDDEWQSCNRKYEGKCSYVGGEYITNSIEMMISESFHGQLPDFKKKCLRHSNGDSYC